MVFAMNADKHLLCGRYKYMIAPMRKGPLYILVSNKELSSVLIFGQEKKPGADHINSK